MNSLKPADEMVLAALEPYMSDLGYAFVVQEVEKAGGIRQVTNTVALAELEMAKKRFSSRSAAGQYAANVRWQGQQKEFMFPDPQGRVYRTATVGGKTEQFEVTMTTAGKVKAGDIVSSGSMRVPMTVTGVAEKNGKLMISLRGENNSSAVTQTMPSAKVRIWRSQQADSDGALDTSRRVNRQALSRQDKEYIAAGKTSPERVRRRNEVIDRYAAEGRDVQNRLRKPSRGGKTWLGEGYA